MALVVNPIAMLFVVRAVLAFIEGAVVAALFVMFKVADLAPEVRHRIMHSEVSSAGGAHAGEEHGTIDAARHWRVWWMTHVAQKYGWEPWMWLTVGGVVFYGGCIVFSKTPWLSREDPGVPVETRVFMPETIPE